MKRRLVQSAFVTVVWLFVVAVALAPSLKARSAAPVARSVVAFRYSPQLLQFGPDDRGVVHTGFASQGWRWTPVASVPSQGQRRLGSDLLKVNLASLSLVLPLHGAGWFPTFGGSLRGQSRRFAYQLDDNRYVSYHKDFIAPRRKPVETALAAGHPVQLTLREPNWKK